MGFKEVAGDVATHGLRAGKFQEIKKGLAPRYVRARAVMKTQGLKSM